MCFSGARYRFSYLRSRYFTFAELLLVVKNKFSVLVLFFRVIKLNLGSLPMNS